MQNANPGACELFGMTAAELNGRNLGSLLVGAVTLPDTLAAAMRGEAQERSFDARHKSGTARRPPLLTPRAQSPSAVPERSPRAQSARNTVLRSLGCAFRCFPCRCNLVWTAGVSRRSSRR